LDWDSSSGITSSQLKSTKKVDKFCITKGLDQRNKNTPSLGKPRNRFGPRGVPTGGSRFALRFP
jgi:hypothetical protein